MARKRDTKHLSYNDIPDFQTDWMEDTTNENKRFAGESVQKFIKKELQKGYGYSRMSSGYIQFFRSADDADAYDAGDTTKLLHQDSLQGTNVEFRFVNQPSGNIYINGSNAYLLPVTVRSVDVNSDGSETAHDANISLAIQVNLNNGTTTTELGTFPANEQFTVNITPYVADGATFILVASDDDGFRRTSSRYTVTRANLGIAFQNNNWWATAYHQGDTQWNVPLALDVNVAAELTATIRKGNVNYVTKTVPSSQFSAIYALTLEHPMANGGTEGVYELHLELRATDENLSSMPTETLDMNIFCVAQDSTALLLATNNVATELQNYTNNRVFDYAVFAGSGNHTLTITAKEGNDALAAPQTIETHNGTIGSYYLNMEMERIDNADYTVTVAATFDASVVRAFSADITATNQLGYAATAGASLLVKATGRSNSEADREKLVNLLTGDQITPTWQNMTWSSVDGYQTRTIQDTAGQNVEVAFIRLLSGQTLLLHIQPLKMTANQGRTVEMLIQPRNVQNYDTPIVQCLDTDAGVADAVSAGRFSGLLVKPSRVTLLTNGSRDQDTQSKNFDPEDLMHLTIVVNPAYNEAGRSFSACFIYMNGVKQRVFAYSKDLNVSAQLLFGGADADLDIYAVRTYNKALTSDEVVTNADNWKFSLADKAAFKAKNNIKENGRVDFNKVRSLCNVFVLKSNDGQGRIPSYGMGKKDTIPSTLRLYWRDNPEWNSTVALDAQGQGTSSMDYLRWNGKGKTSTPWAMDGGTHTAISTVCWKKNFASSMQSHKMGGTEEYDYLARMTGAVEADAARQAIWQYPFVGFSEDAQGNLTFIGLYTMGPDKGDKATFGFTDNTVAMEGLDNDLLAANFRVPWNDSTVTADADKEKYTVCGEKAWEDSMKSAKKNDYVNTRWKPAYNLAYECSQLIRPWKGATVPDASPSGSTTYADTAEGLQQYAAVISAIDTSTDEGKEQYEAAVMYEYWISGTYDLYRYDKPSGEYVQSYTTAAINLSTALCGKGYVVGTETSGGQTTDILLTTTLLANATVPSGSPAGTTVDDVRNDLFKRARLSKFKKEASNYWDITNCFFHLAWVEFKAATDNLAKNTYPYLLDGSDPDCRWRWRQDDVDTVGPIENQGKDKKPYCVELEDNYSSYGMASLYVWNGRFSQFWFTLKEAFATEYAEWVRTTFFQALHYGSATNMLQRVMDFFQHFEFDRAQEYFGAALYNADSIWTYEQAYLYTGDYTYKSIALEQALGDHYSAEKYWYRMRTIYMMSKYQADLFAAANTVDTFATRPAAGTNTYTITPAIYMYPVVQNGQSAWQGPRFWPGNPSLTQWTTDPITTAGDQTIRINGMSYIASVGDLYANTLKEAVGVSGRLLRELNLGSHTADPQDIKSTVTAVTIDNATSLRTLDLAQLPTLAGTVNLTACANLREVYAGGTALASVVLSDGGPLSTLVLGDNITTLQLLGKQMLTNLTIGSTSRLANVEMQNCNDYTAGRVLAILAAVQASQLSSVRLIFGQAANPTVVTDEDIATILALNGSDIETKQFSGYITKESGSITAETYNALYNIGIDWAGNITPEVTLALSKLTVGVPVSGTNTVQATATAIPRNAQVTYSIPETTGVTINADTGLITVTPEAQEDTEVVVTAVATYGGQSATATQTLTILTLEYPTSAYINGQVRINTQGAAGAKTYSLTLSPADYSENSITAVSYAISGGNGAAALTQSGSGSARTATVTASTVTANAVNVTLTATITLRDGSVITASKVIVIQDSDGFVDLGLPSETRWAEGNIVKDANDNYYVGHPTDDGAFFSWANIDGHNPDEGYDFTEETYAETPGALQDTDIAPTDAAHDAALARLGTGYSMATRTQAQELIDNCTAQWQTNYNGTGVAGMLLTSNINGNSIFIPASGLWDGKVISLYNLRSVLLLSYFRDGQVGRIVSAEEVILFNLHVPYVGRNIRAVQNAVPITGFSLSGDAEITEAGSYAYTIADILPANHNRGIASLAASVTVPATGSIVATVPAGSTTGVTLAVTTMPDATETVTLTVTATLASGGNVTATKQIELKVAAAGGDLVDLGLPSGTLWAKGNIVKDANGNYSVGNETDYGCYFSWGNVEGHNEGEGYNFNQTSYDSTPGMQVSADIASNDSTHDAALATLGGSYRMPTKTEFQELYDNTDTEWTTIDGVAGRKFMKKSDHSVYVFFPAAGNYDGTSLGSRGTAGYYWSSSWSSGANAYSLYSNSSSVLPQNNNYRRRGGCTVRAVQ